MKAQGLEQALGFSPNVEAKPGSTLRRARVDLAALKKAVGHWRSRASNERPYLRGLTHSPGKEPFLNVILDLGDREPYLCLEAEVTGQAFPDFSAVWPYSRWWQEELETFSALRFEEREEAKGVSWRLT